MSRHQPSVVVRRILVSFAFVLVLITVCMLDVQMRTRTASGELENVEEEGDTSPPGQQENDGKSLQTSRKLSYLENEEDNDILQNWDDENFSRTYNVPLFLNKATHKSSESGDDVRGVSSSNSLTKRLPHAIIIGVKKGGTRALLEILRLHPDVRAPGPEPHFFDRHFHKGIKWYRKQMPFSWEGQITVEKTPSYFVTPEVPSRVHDAFGKNIRLLVVVRDPVTRAVSDYTQASSKRPTMDTRTFEEMAFLNFSTGLVDTNWSAIKIGVYAKHLQRWLSYFPLSQFHFISGERLISDPVAELEAVQKFLGLRNFISDQHFFFNQTKGFPCLRRSAHSTTPHCLGKTKGRSHPRITPSAEQRLRDFYRPFNQKFYRIVDRNFSWP